MQPSVRARSATGAWQTAGVEMREFWTFVGQARADVSGDDGWASGSAIGGALSDRLAQLPLERILAFDSCYSRAIGRADQWAVCAAAFVIWHYISDDTFSDFKAGLVGLGQDAFERVVTDPDELADHPMVRAIAAGKVDRFALSGGGIESAAPRAYERLSDDEDAFWEALENQPTDTSPEEEPTGGLWSGEFGDPDDAAQIPVRLPRLHALFASSPSGGRP